MRLQVELVLQRFLLLPQLNVKALWFPILKYWLRQHFGRGKHLSVVMDRTQWKHHNLLMVAVVYQKRTIPLYWHLLDKQGQSSLSDQQAVLRPGFALLRRFRLVVLADREFHSVSLAAWLKQKSVSFVLRLPKSTTVKLSPEREFERLDALTQFPGIAVHEVQVQVTQQQGFGRVNLVTCWKRVYREGKANQVGYLLTNLECLEAALDAYASWGIELMFRDFKTGGYNLENTQVNGQRFLALVLLIALSYTLASEQGKQIRRQQVQHYVARVLEPKRVQKRHSDFHIGLYGRLWVEAMDNWSDWAAQLMRLKPQKLSFF